MKITVLAENSVCKTNFLNHKAEDGLSLFIEFDEKKILFETGQSDIFIQNAWEMGIDLSQVDYLVISNCPSDNRGGLKHFQKINNKAKVFLHNYAAPYFGGLDKKSIAQNSRIYFIDQDTQIEDKIILLDGFTEDYPQQQSANALFEKTKNRFTADKISRELTMLLIENDEIVLFSGCSHSKIINTIDEVRLFSETMKIKATFSGLNIHNPIQKINTGDVILI
jgi:7,8-dihydropterin-6-yl-methyl-4-(beta-D-ribofuranosyl)aminobenzene 5'-phosphate synthase